MKLKHLESALQEVTLYSQLGRELRQELEQYSTSPHLAARMVYAAQMEHGDIEDMNVLDLGCGTGILGIAAAMLGAGHVLGVDVDPEALSTAAENTERCEVDDIMDLLCCDARVSALRGVLAAAAPAVAAAEVGEVAERGGGGGRSGGGQEAGDERPFDTVLTNPPFGTRRAGADIEFLCLAMGLARRAVYTMHKVIAQLRFDIPATYKHHRQRSVDVEVDLIRVAIAPPPLPH